MNIIETTLPGVVIVEPKVHGDARGFFMEAHRHNRYADQGIAPEGFVQDNLSFSGGGVLRGLHFQNPDPQGKLVYVLQGEVFDVAVDIRRGAPTFAKWFGVRLTGENKRQLYVPPGFAHGFLVLSETALFTYKCTAYYNPDTDAGIAWDDPEVAIDWPVKNPVLSDKDRHAPTLRDIDPSRLPEYEESNQS